jgi:hypothetical protein
MNSSDKFIYLRLEDAKQIFGNLNKIVELCCSLFYVNRNLPCGKQ